MKQSNKKNQKVQKPTRPFEGMIQQLNKETLILVNLVNVKAFVKECFERKIRVDVGSLYGDGVIIYKK